MVWRTVIPISLFPHQPLSAIFNRAKARMRRLFCHCAVMAMMRPLLALSLLLLVSAGVARAQETAPAACTVASVNILSQNQGGVTITCTRLSEDVGNKFADILT